MSVFFTLVNYGFSIYELIRLNDLNHFIEDEVKKLSEVKQSELDVLFQEYAKDKNQQPLTVNKIVEEKGIEFTEGQPIVEKKRFGNVVYSGQINSLNKPHGLGIVKGFGWGYEGSFRNGKKDGYGRMYFWNGSIYKGYF